MPKFSSWEDVDKSFKEGRIRNLGQGGDGKGGDDDEWMLISADGDEIVVTEEFYRGRPDRTSVSTDADLSEDEVTLIVEIIGDLWNDEVPKIPRPSPRSNKFVW